MSDEYDGIKFQAANVEYEIERQKWNLDPTDASPVPSVKKLGCLGVFVRVIVGLILFRLAAELLNLIFLT